MAAPSTTPFHDEDSRDVRLDLLARMIREETDALLAEAVPAALARQWSASPIPQPRQDTHERVTGDRSDPTADVALDLRRLAVRDAVERVAVVLRDAAVSVRGSRLALERAVARFDGEEPV